jgi:hypothetical protein
MRTPEKIPKALMDIMGLKIFAKNATALVLDVTVIVLTPHLNAYAILRFLSDPGRRLCFQASTKTKMSSAAIPITKKIEITYRLPN